MCDLDFFSEFQLFVSSFANAMSTGTEANMIRASTRSEVIMSGIGTVYIESSFGSEAIEPVLKWLKREYLANESAG